MRLRIVGVLVLLGGGAQAWTWGEPSPDDKLRALKREYEVRERQIGEVRRGIDAVDGAIDTLQRMKSRDPARADAVARRCSLEAGGNLAATFECVERNF